MTAGRLHHVVDGPSDAPVLVLGNSLGTTVAMWDALVPELARRLRVVRYDLPGHGGSPAGDRADADGATIAGLAQDVLALLDRLDVRRAHLAGVSIGAMIAMEIAATAPQRVDRLALFATSAFLATRDAYGARARTVLAEGIDPVADAVVARWFTPQWAEAHPDLVDRMHAMIRSIDPIGYARCCLALQAMDLRDELPRITAPTLVIAGGADEAIPVADSELIAASIPGARLLVVADAAHLLPFEHPATAARLLLEHLGVAGRAEAG